MSKAQGQFTIIDYNDALTLTGFINSSAAKTQMFNPDNGSYNQDWSSSNVVLTPSLFVLGSTIDKITDVAVTSVTWYIGSGTTAITNAGSYELSGTKNHVLKVKGNVMAGLPGIDFRCEVNYLDPTTGLSLLHKMSISFSRVVNGGGIVDLIVTTPSGNVFKNTSVASLTAKADLWRGSVIDTTLVAYQWYKMDSTITVDEGGGVGWKKLVDASGSFQGSTTNTLTIPASTVNSYATFKCIAKDTDSASNTYNSSYIDTASFIDNSDPLQIVITSTGGDVFKNGTGSTTLRAVAYQAGVEVDSAGSGTYKWTKYNKDGAVDTTWGTSGVKTGKTLSVGDADVTVKATFLCEVTI